MSRIYKDNSESIGRTPLVHLARLGRECKATILGKVEGRNPAFSVKCRIGASMVWDAEERGVLKQGMEIVEPTSGNTGIALAYVAASRGYGLTLTMPDTMSVERRRVLAAFGANLILTPGSGGMKGAIAKAEELAQSDPSHYFMPQQFKNPANPAIHEKTTGPEIWTQSGGSVDVFVVGVGTGGTITGVGRALRERKPAVELVAVEPASSPVLSGGTAGSHMIQGIGAGFIPEILDRTLLDRIITVNAEDAARASRRLANEEGIFSGISAGANVHAALQLAADETYRDKTIVTVICDTGERYLSTWLYEEASL